MKKESLGTTKKLRTISIDSDVINDILALEYLKRKTRLTKDERRYLKRCETSFNLLAVLFSIKVDLVGTEIVKKELQRYPPLGRLYDRIFSREIKITVGIRRLTKTYISELNIKPADTLILASISLGKVDCFLSWNREHIVNQKTIESIKKINKKKNIHIPLIITPDDLLPRIFLSQDRTLCYTIVPIPSEFRPQIYPSK